MGLDSHASPVRPRERLKSYLHGQYQGAHRAKSLARDIECTTKTAENILDGHWPNDLHMGAIVRRFGRDIWNAVFEAEVEPVIAELTQQERELEEELARIKSRRRQAEGGGQGHTRLRSAAADPRRPQG